jgi:hypothetical protein
MAYGPGTGPGYPVAGPGHDISQGLNGFVNGHGCPEAGLEHIIYIKSIKKYIYKLLIIILIYLLI